MRAQWREVGKVAFNSSEYHFYINHSKNAHRRFSSSENKFAIKLMKTASDTATPLPLFLSDNYQAADYCLLVKGVRCLDSLDISKLNFLNQAPDVLIRRCSHFIDSNGRTAPLNAPTVDGISAVQEDFASRGQRVLLLAKKVITSAELSKESLTDPTVLEDRLVALNVDLVFVGLLALVDPPRHDTAETVRVCRGAGIRFAMVTGMSALKLLSNLIDSLSPSSLSGDFSLTAVAIAHQVGIITNPIHAVNHITDLPYDLPLDQIPPFNDNKQKGDTLTSLVLSGAEMQTMTESQWKQVLTVSLNAIFRLRCLQLTAMAIISQFDEIVFARTSPQQKLQIVKTFQTGGCTVAVTGDGGECLFLY